MGGIKARRSEDAGNDRQTWFERRSRTLASAIKLPASYAGLGLLSGWLGWELGALRDVGIGYAVPLVSPKLFFDYGEILGGIVCLLLLSRTKKLSSNGALALLSTACMFGGSLFVMLANGAAIAPPSWLMLFVALASGVGYIVQFLLWLEVLGFVSPVSTMLAYSVAYLISSCLWFCTQSMALEATNTLALLLPLGSLLFFAAASGRKDAPSCADMESPGRPSVTRIIVWVWIFAFAYGVGGEFTKMSYSTAAAKLGVFVAALIIALGIVLAAKRLDYSVFYRLSFVFMAFGFVVSLVVDNPALMQACMSASNALVTILAVTFACGAAYFRRRSSLTILAPTFVGWYVASLVGKNFASVLLQAWNVPVSAEITIASLLIIVLFLVALFWFREIDFLTYWQTAVKKSPGVPPDEGSPEKFENLSKREMNILTLIAAGRSQAEIAQELFIAPGTVRAHVNHIYTKLDVHSKEELQDLLKRDSSESEPFDS